MLLLRPKKIFCNLPIHELILSTHILTISYSQTLYHEQKPYQYEIYTSLRCDAQQPTGKIRDDRADQ